MQLINILATLAFAVLPLSATPVDSSSLEERASSNPFTLVIKGNKTQLGGLNGLPIIGGYTVKHKKSPLSADTGTAHPSGTKFTVSKGSLHWHVYKKSFSTTNIVYGEPIVGHPGSGSNDYLRINLTSGYLTFKRLPMGPSQNDFRICKTQPSPGVEDFVVTLGDYGKHTCYPAFLKADFSK